MSGLTIPTVFLIVTMTVGDSHGGHKVAEITYYDRMNQCEDAIRHTFHLPATHMDCVDEVVTKDNRKHDDR